jgi:hypothetical protein
MNRRRILTGLVAAPFVARLGLLMPVRSVLASGGFVTVEWNAAFAWGWASFPAACDPTMMLRDMLKQANRPPVITASSQEALDLFIKKHVDPRSLTADGNLRAEIRICDEA